MTPESEKQPVDDLTLQIEQIKSDLGLSEEALLLPENEEKGSNWVTSNAEAFRIFLEKLKSNSVNPSYQKFIEAMKESIKSDDPETYEKLEDAQTIERKESATSEERAKAAELIATILHGYIVRHNTERALVETL